MPKPSLRELLGLVRDCDKFISPETYALLQALVKRWEAEEVEKHMASLAYVHTELAEAKAEVEKLRKMRDDVRVELSEERQVSDAAHLTIGQVMKERDDAKAEIERLRKCKTWWEHSVESWKAEEISWREEMDELRQRAEVAESRLAETKAEIERLRKDPFDEHVRVRCQNAERARDRLINEHDRLVADADIGRLVLGMRRGTRLKRRFNDGLYEAQAEKATPNPRSRFMDNVKGTVGDDPTKALRSIQEVSDAKV